MNKKFFMTFIAFAMVVSIFGAIQLVKAQGVSEAPTTQVTLINLSPVFTATPSDGGVHSGSGVGGTDTNPVNGGAAADTSPGGAADAVVTFSTTAKDANGDQYYLAVCKSDAVTVGNDTFPTCGGGKWPNADPTVTNSTVAASETYTSVDGDAETNAWFAFACDKLPSGSSPACFPAPTTPGGDQGRALGTVTFADVPADEDNITIDGITYVFDTGSPDNCVTAGTCVDLTSDNPVLEFDAEDGDGAAAALAAAEAGASSYMANRGAVVYVYANSSGSGGNSIGMAINACANCTLSGATLTGGDDENASPFYVNHAPEITAVAITDTSDATIEPGDVIKFAVTITDSDSVGGADTVDIHVCDTNSFTPGTGCAANQTICKTTGAATGTVVCQSDDLDNNLTYTINDIPEPHCGYQGVAACTVYVFAEDNADFKATYSSGDQIRTYSVEDVVPEWVSNTMNTTFGAGITITAAGSTSVSFSIVASDDNGDDDIVNIDGTFFDDTVATQFPTPVDNTGEGTTACQAHHRNCYIASACSLDTADHPGSSTLPAAINRQGTCGVTVYYNANASDDWQFVGFADDQTNTDTALDQTTGTAYKFIANAAIDVVQTSIAYGTVNVGGTSSAKETSLGNAGNQNIDILVTGTDMTCSSGGCTGKTIDKLYQKWWNNVSTLASFDWDVDGTGGTSSNTTDDGSWTLVESSNTTNEEGGCVDKSLYIRAVQDATTENESVYWKIRIPEATVEGTYGGTNTFTSTTSDCTYGNPL